mmetsp:Transcript_23256/g.43717  ORF Transcript_23256/g.43717 Transcript_23256/m.43717 type:complete len:226 (+) Transcript_23256:52-729(+)
MVRYGTTGVLLLPLLGLVVLLPNQTGLRRSWASHLQAGPCATGLEQSLQVLRRVASNGSHAAAQALHQLAAYQDVLGELPQVRRAVAIRAAAATQQAGGRSVILGAAVAGGTGGLCLGALLWSGESPAAQKRLVDAIEMAHQRNRTAALRTKLRRGLRRRLLLTSAASAAAAAYLCTQPTTLEGGSEPMASATGVARRLGRAAASFGSTLLEAPPRTRQRRRWQI